jgi:hypothetical protein
MLERAVATWLAVVVVLALLAEVAAAQPESDIPEVRFATVIGVRENVGEFGERFGRGGMWGFEAGYQPGRLGVAWSIGWSVPNWTAVLVGGSFDSVDAESVDEEVGLTEMSLGLRLRWPLGDEAPRFLIASAGASALRASIPIPPDSTREYIGPYLGAGVEQLLVGRYMLALEARYGMFVGGPAGLTVNMSVAFGSR